MTQQNESLPARTKKPKRSSRTMHPKRSSGPLSATRSKGPARTSQSQPKRAKVSQTTKPKRPAKQPVKGPRRNKKLTPLQMEQMRTLAMCKHISIVVCAALLGCGAVVGLLLFARPSISMLENRALTAFPAITWSGFWDGSFFSDVSLWYSDTYPTREQMVSANKALEALHGLTTETQMIGGTKQADELPPVEQDSGQNKDKSQSSSDSTKTSQKTQKHEKVEVPNEEAVAAAVQNQITDGLYIKGDTVYNVYYFSQDAVEEYADALNQFADAVGKDTTVYSIVVPNSSGVVLPEDEAKALGGTNQEDALKYFYSQYNPNVIAVDTMASLKEHDDEYLYFRTDHHWTALGAYYGYLAFCKEKGMEPEDLDDLKYQNMGDFLGSYYLELNSDALAANPDQMEAWYPNDTNEMTLYDTDGSADTYPIVTDNSKASPLEKGMTFIMGDQALEKISNPKVSDGSSVLVIKDSFGDFFVPWLVDNYETVWVADFRYFEGSYLDLIKENDIKDVIVLNNISLAGGGVVAPSILGKL